MHSFDAPSGVTYFHHGDLSGNVEVTLPVAHGGASFERDGHHVAPVEIPAADLKALVAEWLRNEKIARLENATNDEVFDL